MSKFLDRFRYFKQKGETFADGHGQLLETNRDWEDGYRQRWQHDKIVRSTHGVNCTGSCSWKIYVKNGLVTWETQRGGKLLLTDNALFEDQFFHSGEAVAQVGDTDLETGYPV
ncbi:hypothetical protein PXZ57_18205, partial [Salmonella enterica subsp. enterica serovar Typhimurium]